MYISVPIIMNPVSCYAFFIGWALPFLPTEINLIKKTQMHLSRFYTLVNNLGYFPLE